MRTGAAASLVAFAFAACLSVACAGGGEDRPPPIGGTRGSSPGVVGGEVGGVDDDGGQGGATTGMPGTTAGATAGTTSVDLSILSGSILTDESRFPLPMGCSLRLHDPSAVDPGTGLSTGPLVDVEISVDGTPQPFDIGLDDVRDIVNQGDLVYVEIVCDANGDGSFDPIGGWFPVLPAEIVQLPANDIDLTIDDLPV